MISNSNQRTARHVLISFVCVFLLINHSSISSSPTINDIGIQIGNSFTFQLVTLKIIEDGLELPDQNFSLGYSYASESDRSLDHLLIHQGDHYTFKVNNISLTKEYLSINESVDFYRISYDLSVGNSIVSQYEDIDGLFRNYIVHTDWERNKSYLQTLITETFIAPVYLNTSFEILETKYEFGLYQEFTVNTGNLSYSIEEEFRYDKITGMLTYDNYRFTEIVNEKINEKMIVIKQSSFRGPALSVPGIEILLIIVVIIFLTAFLLYLKKRSI